MFAWHDTPGMWAGMILFWSLFVVFGYYAVNSFKRPTAAHGPPRATDILEERFARGEISAEEYRDSRDTLETTGAHRDDR